MLRGRPRLTIDGSCSVCGLSEPEVEFYYNKKGSRSRAKCRMCQQAYKKQQEYNKKWNLRNPDKVKASKQRWYRKNRARILVATAKYREDTVDKRKETNSNWKKNNPDKVIAKQHRRRVSIRKSAENWTSKQWLELKRYYSSECLCCGAIEPAIKLTPDHVIPLSKGGSNSIDNIQPLCLSCNCRKSTKTTDYRAVWQAKKQVASDAVELGEDDYSKKDREDDVFSDYVTTIEAAEMLGIRTDTVLKLVNTDQLAAVLVGRSWLIKKSEVERYRAESSGRGWSDEDRTKRLEAYRKGWEGPAGEARRQALREAALERNRKKKEGR